MKAIYKLLMTGTVLLLPMGANAGEQGRSDLQRIRGDGGSLGSHSIRVTVFCDENPNGMGGVNVSGRRQITGHINNNSVDLNESFYGHERCPDIFNKEYGSENQVVHVSMEGVTVNADCTNQVTHQGSGTNHYTYPDQQNPVKYSNHWKRHYTSQSDYLNGSCVITATDASGITETFDTYGFAEERRSFDN